MPEKMPPGLAPRVAVSIATVVGWLVFLIIFLAFHADHFTVYQNLAIFLASILVVGAILGSMWAYWGIKYGWKWEQSARRRSRRSKEV
jgi:heme/copper-type cytochrome/quinol oxidase subunit 4